MGKYFYPYVNSPQSDTYDVHVLSDETRRCSNISLKFQEGILVCEEPLLHDAYLDKHEMKEFAKRKRGRFVSFGTTLNLEQQLVLNED